MNYIQDNIFLGQLPKRLIIGCVDSNALNGTITKNPFDFKHYNINFVAINPSVVFPSSVQTCFGPAMLSGP
jgi:hypothetical protein